MNEQFDVFDADDDLELDMAEVDPILAKLAPIFGEYNISDITWRLGQLCREKAEQIERDYPDAISPPAWRSAANKLEKLSWDI